MTSARFLLAPLALLLSGCGTLTMFSDDGPAPPRNVADACSILDERDDWEDPVFDAARRWDVTPGTILAFMRQESSFRHDARPIDRNGRPLSSALGYSQALDGTWRDYQNARGRADRTDFKDSADFIGWYANVINRVAGVSTHDPRNLYLAYHDGPGGFQRGTWRSKTWLINVADRVAGNAAEYDRQLARCERRKMRQFADNRGLGRFLPF